EFRLVQDSAGDYFVEVTGAKNGPDATADANGYYAASIGKDGEVKVDDWTATATPAGNAPTGENMRPMDALDKALQEVDNLRSHLGAIQNRFESTIANLSNTVTNLSAAR